MAEKVLPLWSVHDMYIQVNAKHGYRYLDLAGVVLNILSDRYKKVDVISPAGTSLSDPIDMKDPYQIQFAAERIWLHYVGVDAVQKIGGTAPELIKSIAERIEMNEFIRFGFRISYFIEVKDVLKAAEIMTKKLICAPVAGLVSNRRLDIPTNLEIPLVFKDMEVIFRFRWVVIKRPSIDPSDYSGNGLILDIDLGQRSTEVPFNRHDLTKLMSRAVETQVEFLTKYGQPLLQGAEL